MDTITYRFSIPDGYRVVRDTFDMELSEAVNILCSDRQWRYGGAVRREDGRATLVAYNLVCPYCGRRTPSYLMGGKGDPRGEAFVYRRRPDELIETWGSGQVLMFPDDHPAEIRLNRRAVPMDRHTCEGCGRESVHASTARPVSVELDGRRTVIRAEILGPDELFGMRWLSRGEVTITLPMHERLVINHRNGHTHLELCGADGAAIAIRDVTYYPALWDHSVTGALLRDNWLIRRVVKKHFEELFGGALPFLRDELTPEKYALMNRFIGYNRDFYYAIPFRPNSERVEASFRRIGRRLHTVDGARRSFMASSLPQSKSVKRMYYLDQGLFFYIEEAEVLYGLLDDVNLFRRMMTGRLTYAVLSCLRVRPGVAEFLRDYVCRVGGVKATNQFTENWSDVVSYATEYHSMSERCKERERARWTGKVPPWGRKERSGYSLPMKVESKRVRDCEVDGYHFAWLRSSREYAEVATEMKNCLGNWTPDKNRVICVRKDGRAVAAIELNEDVIYQARGVSNKALSCDAELERAYMKWKGCFGLEEYAFARFYDDFDNMFD